MAWIGACAQQGAPPGGLEDQRPPVVVATFPEALATLEELGASVRFDFDERISERVAGGTLDDAITVSPRGGEVRVTHGRRSLTVSVEGGFQPEIVYRVTVLPVVADLFGNQLRDAFELVFTTGDEATPTTLAGQVWDRITGQGVDQASVYAFGADSLVHQSVTSQEGIYALRYLASGRFRVTAFEDRNRDGDVDSTEVQGMAPASLNPGDTLFLDIPVLVPDTLPAVVTGAEALDSITVAIEFDDYLDPVEAARSVTASLTWEGGAAPEIDTLFDEAGYAAYVDAVADSFARLDSLDRAEADEARRAAAAAADSMADADSVEVADTVEVPDSIAVADSVAVPDSVAVSDSVRVDLPDRRAGAVPQAIAALPTRQRPVTLDPLPGARPGPVAGTDRVLPGRRLVILLGSPIERDVEYRVDVSSVVNINGLTGGGGEAVLLFASPPDTATVDTLAVPDTGLVVPDTGRAASTSLRELFRRR